MVHFVSCLNAAEFDQKRYFEDGAISDEVHKGLPLDISPRRVGELYPAYHYRRPALTSFGPDTEGLQNVRRIADLHSAAESGGSPSVISLIRQAYIRQNGLYMAGRDDQRNVVHESYRPIDRDLIPWISDSDLDNPVAAHRVSKGEIFFWLGSVGSSNYGHWLVDDAPRLKGLIEVASERKVRTVYIVMSRYETAIDRVRIRTVEELLPLDIKAKVKVLFINPFDNVFFEELYYVTPCTYHPSNKSPEAMKWISDTWQHPDGVISTPKRIFVGRSFTGRRELLNISEIGEILARHDFVPITTDRLDVATQARIFRNAEIIVGCMGAAMTNTIFSGPRTKIGVLAPDGWVETFYWDLAAVLRHDYAACYGASTQAERHAHDRDYTIDPEDLAQMLQTLGV